MFNETHMTVCGNVVGTPTLRITKGGATVANFRLASTPRRFDRDQGKWVDGDTLFVSVSCWRGLAENVAMSLHKGEPVIVSGRYYQRNYTVDNQARSAYELDALTVGHDLSRGTAEFARPNRAPATTIRLDEDGLPADESINYLEIAEDITPRSDLDAEFDDSEPGLGVGVDEVVSEVDLDTGEVRDLVGSA